MKVRIYAFAAVSASCLAGSATAAIFPVYSTGFEGGTGSPAYRTLDSYTYVSYYANGIMGDVNGHYHTGQTGTLGDDWKVLGTKAGKDSTGIDLVNGWVDGADGQWIDLIGTPGPGGISRKFSIVAGDTYTLTWSDFSNIGSGSGDTGNTYLVKLGSEKEYVTAQDSWQTKTLTFTAKKTRDNATLEFYSGDHGDGNTGIDNISLSGSAPVPEPFTMALCAGGLGLAISRRRKARKI